MRATFCSLILFWTLMFLMVITSTGWDSIAVTRSLRDGELLVSTGKKFALGFFSPSGGGKRYVGIWYNSIPGQTVVWVANRKTPLLDSAGVLQFSNKSVLVLVNGTGNIIWSTNSSGTAQKPVAQLLNSGNLVVRDQNDGISDNYLWQSFDYPSHVQLPGMKLGKDLITGFERFLTSWKSSDDPSPGSYTFRFDPRGYPQPVLLKNNVEQYREGPWDGVWFSANSLIAPGFSERYQFIFNNKELSYKFDVANNSSRITHRALYSYGILQLVLWNHRTQSWSTFFTKPSDNCDTYEVCGAFAVCDMVDMNVPQCQCMKGFVPKSSQDWEIGVWSDGCVSSFSSVNCSKVNRFNKYSNVKVPDTKNSWYNTTMTLDECKKKCLQNCSYVAYANMVITDGGSGCFLWFNTLVDVKVLSGMGQEIYVRVPSSGHGGKRIWIAVCSSFLAVLLVSGAITVLWRKRRPKKEDKHRGTEENNSNKKDSELPIFPFNVIADATNHFSNSNKLGEGGFGPVYKGTLKDGGDIAVKRLSMDSRQGHDEFKNEAIFIAKLQHRNLVKLIGCCIEAEERMLIYEYMSNESLDYFIFDKEKSGLLDWPTRCEIIKGISRGLLYLHQDSRLRIVHRDLKASNILLDSEMNAKISDFGMARSFDGSDDQAQTKRVVGTYGYMPPEYTIDGLFSVKSDVFSFGVLVLEIVSGSRNRGFNHPDHQHNLLGHAWMLFREGLPLDVVDPSIRNTSYESQMQRSIHIGLLCVQLRPEDRPNMSLVTAMLPSDCELPEPKETGFYVGRNVREESDSTKTESSCSNKLTITSLSAR